MSGLSVIGMTPAEAEIVSLVLKALHKAQTKHGPMNSAHEGYGVIKEELEELSEAFQPLVRSLDRTLNDMDRSVNEALWAGVKADDMDAVLKEAAHVAAMAFRFMLDVPVCKGTRWRKRQVEVRGEGTVEQENNLAERERAVEQALQDREIIEQQRQTIERMRADLVKYEQRHAEDQQLQDKMQQELDLMNRRLLEAVDAHSPRLLRALSQIHDLACNELQTPLAEKPRQERRRTPRTDVPRESEITVVMGGQRFKSLDDALATVLPRIMRERGL